MSIPTRREYERAINGIKHLKELIERNQNDINKHLDVILLIRKQIKDYEEIIERNNELIVLYNLYAERDKIIEERD